MALHNACLAAAFACIAAAFACFAAAFACFATSCQELITFIWISSLL
jgi:hypothetical protein